MVKGLTPLRTIVWLIMLLVVPLIYIAAFNQFFGTGITYTVDNWILAFLVGVLVVLIFIVLLVVIKLGGAVSGPLGVVLAFAAILALPLLYIFSFNLLLSTSVPYTIYTYLLVLLTMIGIWLLSTVTSKVR